jgi:hypothetical protein
LVLKPRPTRAAPRSSRLKLPLSVATRKAHAARSTNSTTSMSIVLLRLVATTIGVTARTSADKSPATGPKVRRTRWKIRATERTPATAWGRSRLGPLKPNSQALAAWIQSPKGGLSTETKPASKETKKKFCQLVSMFLTAAE